MEEAITWRTYVYWHSMVRVRLNTAQKELTYLEISLLVEMEMMEGNSNIFMGFQIIDSPIERDLITFILEVAATLRDENELQLE